MLRSRGLQGIETGEEREIDGGIHEIDLGEFMILCIL